MNSMVNCVCANQHCKKQFQARLADKKRGWGKFCSKRCKAVEQEARTHQYKQYIARTTLNSIDYDDLDDDNDQS